jgi:hypothetical protein
MNDHIASLLEGIITATFVGTWVILAVVGVVASRRMDAVAKRRWWPRGNILVGFLIIFFSTALMVLQSRSWSSLGILLESVPAVVLICYLNIKFTKFCNMCCAAQFNYSFWFAPLRFCSKCGSDLVTIKPSPGGSLMT